MKKILILALLLSVTTVQAQLIDDASIAKTQSTTSYGLKPAVTPFSLLDFSRITWSHSYSVSYFSGGNNFGSSSLGIWNTSMFYDISSKLSLSLNVGIAHNPGAILGDANNSSSVLPGFLLDYHPSENFRISIGMQSYKGQYNNRYNSNSYLYNSLRR